ncbi:TetR/AcrR family transcriptional regulator [Nonomuraea sp. NPDC050310]|uniref:TetR/AcrR family transcriptional regulator n=1 Tax=unclassified Nonomuraea TaxID=2593643 RepID=UPI00340CA3E3
MARQESPARHRIMATASALFYAEGIHAVGIDRIIAEAGVAKATFYHHFPSKDELVRAYIEDQGRLQRAAIAGVPGDGPRERLLALYDALGEWSRQPGFRGCMFINAAAEYPDPAHPVRQAVAAQRAWFRSTVRDLVAAAGHPEAERIASILVLLRDGLAVGADLDDPEVLKGVVREAVLRALGEHVQI